MGQSETVRVVHFITKDTIEENILTLQENKRLLAQGTLEGDMGAINQLRIKDLRLLFKV
jgi:SNF2 family DNA or RNA helicase